MSRAKLETGVELYYETYGEGEAVVLLPGTGFACDVWREHPVSELKDQYKVIIFDSRGIGRSSPIDNFFTVNQLAADTACLLNHLEIEKAYVLGHSIGGRIALALALTYPDRVKSLFLAATGSGASIRPGEGAIQLPPLHLLETLTNRGFQEFVNYEITQTDGYFTEDFRETQPEIVGEFARIIWEHHADLRTYLRYVFARHTFEVTHQLDAIKMPVWIGIGEYDLAGSSPHLPQSIALKERIPQAVLNKLPNLSHGFFWQDPIGTKELLLRWLKESAV